MPQVPQYQRKIGEADAPAVRVSGGYTPDMFGAGIGKSISQVSDALQVQADKMDKAAVIQAENQLRQKTTEYLYGNLFKREGASAAGADKDFEKQYQTMMGEARKGLSGRAQQAFDVISTQYKTSLYPHIQGHMSKQADVAIDDAYKGQLYTDAVTISQPGAWQDQNTVATMLAKGEAATKVLFAGRDPAFVSAKIAERNSNILTAAAKTMKDGDNYGELKQFIDRYEKLMDPRIVAPLREWERQKTEHAAISVEADRIAAMFGDNLAGAAAHIRGLKESGGGRIDETLLKFSSGDNPDWKGVTQSTRAGTAKVFSLLSSMGLQGEITSGKRNNNDSSWHNVGGGADVWLADNGGNRLAADDARVKQVMAEAKKAGWEEVLYHDAGTGIHLHLGNYTGSAAGGGRDPEYYDKLEAKVFAKIGHAKQIRNEQKHDGIIQLNNDLVGLTPEQKVDRIEMDPYLEKSQKADLVKKITAPREKSDISVKYMLQQSVNDGSLSAGDVEKAARYLNETDLMNFMGKVGEIDAKRTNKETESADKKWEQDLQSSMATSSTSAEKREARQALAIEITERLDTEKVKGWARYARAKEIMKETGVVVDGKGDYGKADAIIRYGRGNRERFGMLYGAYDKRVVDLAISGHVQSGMKNPEAEEINKFLMSIGERAKTDTAAQAALDWHIRNRVPLTAASFSDTYDKLVK